MTAKGILGAALIAAALCLAGGGIYAMHRLKQRTFDPDTLCPLQGSKAVTLIIIDKTDPLTAAEQALVRNLVSKEAAALEPGGRITVKLLQQREGASGTVLETAADLCNPGEEANPLFENPKRVAARYQNAFREPIAEALASVARGGPAQASPIAGAISAAIEAVPEMAGQLKLILVSDLIEYTAEASAYTGTLSGAALQKALPQSIQGRLKGAEIRAVLLGRPRYAKQQDAAVAIWRRFLQAISGREPDIVRP